jgi:hypothetical protein
VSDPEFKTGIYKAHMIMIMSGHREKRRNRIRRDRRWPWSFSGPKRESIKRERNSREQQAVEVRMREEGDILREGEQ